MSRPTYLKIVATLVFETSRCCGCGMCTTVCPHGVFAPGERTAEIVDLDRCMECGACANNCPAGAIHVEAGVGCAAAVINSMLGRTDSSCCCIIEKRDPLAASDGRISSRSGPGCC
mgnify:CR=1 FL=1